jgi:hypothetical protein
MKLEASQVPTPRKITNTRHSELHTGRFCEPNTIWIIALAYPMSQFHRRYDDDLMRPNVSCNHIFKEYKKAYISKKGDAQSLHHIATLATQESRSTFRNE